VSLTAPHPLLPLILITGAAAISVVYSLIHYKQLEKRGEIN
jgi:hypothetical protein